METDNKLLKVTNLGITFNSDEGLVRAVDGISFTAQSVMHLLPNSAMINGRFHPSQL